MKYLGIRKASASEGTSTRANSDNDLSSWQQYDLKHNQDSAKREVSEENSTSTSTMSQKNNNLKVKQTSVPIGLLGVVEKDGIDILFANDEGKRQEHNMLKDQVSVDSHGEDTIPIAPRLKSKKRFQAVQIADTARWNPKFNAGSLPVGLLGVVPDSQIEMVFDEQKEELRRRNVEVARLLVLQREELCFVAAQLKSEKLQEDASKKLERQDSLMLNREITNACRLLAAESEAELQEAQDEIRLLREELTRVTSERVSLLQQAEALKDEIKRCKVRFQTNLCIVCTENDRDHAFLPCGHLSVCSLCVSSEEHCPVCKKTSSAIIEIFY
jgi:hypothetical protein